MFIGATPQRNPAMALRIRGALICLTYKSGAYWFLNNLYVFNLFR